MLKDVLLTGFGPFGPYEYNPVEDIAKFFDCCEVIPPNRKDERI